MAVLVAVCVGLRWAGVLVVGFAQGEGTNKDENDIGAGLSKGNCHGLANTAGAAGDEGGFAREAEGGEDVRCHFEGV